MKLFYRFSLMLLALLLPALATAHDFEVDGIYYNINGSEASVTFQGSSSSQYNEYSDSVVIPATVNYSGTTYSVTSIDRHAFSGCKGLTSIDIEILPVEVPLQKAYDIIGKYYSHNRIISKMSSDTTHFYWDNAQGIKEDISNELLRCETYCFHKSGFTVVISSYGIKQDYISIKDIASSIEMTSKPYDEEQMKKLISQYEKDAPVEAKKAIQKMLPPGYECKDANLINHGEHYTMECTLTGNFSYSELLPLSQNTSKINALQTMLSYTSFGPYTVYAPHIMKAELYGLKTFLLFVDTKGQRIEFKR